MKLKLNTLTIALGSIGVLMILFSLGWHIRFPDWSQTFIVVCLGIIFLGFAYMCEFTRRLREENKEWKQKFEEKFYDKFKELDNVVRQLEEWAKQKFEKIEKELGE